MDEVLDLVSYGDKVKRKEQFIKAKATLFCLAVLSGRFSDRRFMAVLSGIPRVLTAGTPFAKNIFGSDIMTFTLKNKKTEVNEKTLERKRILFVDDDKEIRLFYYEVLSKAGYEVDMAENGMEASGKLNKSQYDLIITAVNMPGLDGIDLYLMTPKDVKDRLKFLFMTGGACEDMEAQSMLSGMEQKYIVKPFGGKELVEKIEKITGEVNPAGLTRVKDKFLNRRSGKRYCWEEDCRIIGEVSARIKPFASIMDISRQGARIRYMGSPMTAGIIISIEIKYLEVRTSATVVWSKEINENEAISGLKLSPPISVSAILSVVKGKKTFIPPLVSSK